MQAWLTNVRFSTLTYLEVCFFHLQTALWLLKGSSANKGRWSKCRWNITGWPQVTLHPHTPWWVCVCIVHAWVHFCVHHELRYFFFFPPPSILRRRAMWISLKLIDALWVCVGVHWCVFNKDFHMNNVEVEYEQHQPNTQHTHKKKPQLNRHGGKSKWHSFISALMRFFIYERTSEFTMQSCLRVTLSAFTSTDMPLFIHFLGGLGG